MISIIIPTYNGELHIDRCLTSILQQTYRDIEIIIIDDWSTDYTYLKCLEYKRLDDRIQVIRQSVNKGVSFARNTGIELAKGEYICFVDDDDELYSKDTLQKMYKPEYDLICGNYELLNNADANKNKFILCTYQRRLDRRAFLQSTYEYIRYPRGTNNLYSEVWSKLHRTSIIKDNNIRFNEHMTKDEVVAFSIEYATHVSNCLLIPDLVYKFHFMSDAIEYYNKYESGKGNMVLNMVSTFKKAEQFLVNTGVDNNKKNELLISFMNYYLNRYLYYNNLLELV